jgi:ABC-type long-subunit fatty acid transport system fused permease/ATPase subunit
MISLRINKYKNLNLNHLMFDKYIFIGVFILFAKAKDLIFYLIILSCSIVSTQILCDYLKIDFDIMTPVNNFIVRSIDLFTIFINNGSTEKEKYR